MSYLNRLPRRLVVIYLPLAIFVFVLLFPFYWMAITADQTQLAAHRLRKLQPLLGGRADA